MKLLLCKNIPMLGIVGDIVTVAPGYARNYLLPQGLATEPTEVNVRALAGARKHAELEREHERAELVKLAEHMNEVEVTVAAKTNEQGHLYGSVGAREISNALKDEGYPIEPAQIVLEDVIRQLDTVSVELKLAEGLTSTIKVWVVRDKTEDDEMDDEEARASESTEDQFVATGREAGEDDNSPGE
jgi:large subunit ribosomal protein L9